MINYLDDATLMKALRGEYGKAKVVRTYIMWCDVKAYGTFEMNYKGGEYWSCWGCLYRLDKKELPAKELKELEFIESL